MIPLLSFDDARAEDGGPAAPLVAIDAGHTSSSPGATGARGTRERDLNLSVARQLTSAIESVGFRAVLLGGGHDLDNAARVELARRLGANAFVSVHHDSVQPRYLETWRVDGTERRYSDRFSGFSVFFSRAGGRPAESLSLARAIGEALVAIGLTPTRHHAEPIPGEGRELVDPALGVYRHDDLAVLRHASMPAVLIECGVIVNRDEEIRLRSPERQKAFAVAVARALLVSFRTKE